MPETPAAAASSALPSSPSEAPAARPRRWGRWVLGAVGGLIVLALVGLQFLDPWLRRTLERQVARRTHDQYRLQVGELRTSLWQRAVRLRNLRLRPAAAVADALPRIRLDVARLHITGLGLLALLRRGVVSVDSIVLDSARVEVLALAQRPVPGAGQPLHERLPLNIKGLAIGYAGLTHARAHYHPAQQPAIKLNRADLNARDLLISPAGAADSQRLGYAAAWNLQLLGAQVRAVGHRLRLKSLQVSTGQGLAQLDSLRVEPVGTGRRASPAVDLALARLRLTGFDARALGQRWLRADSLVVLGPQLTTTLPAKAAPGQARSLTTYLRRLDLAHLALRGGYLRVAGVAGAPVLRGLAVGATTIHYDSAAVPAAGQVLFAKAWTVALGRSEATVAAHALALGSLRLSTAAGSFELRGVRIRRPAPGRGQPGGARVALTLPRLVLTGFDAAALQHRRRFVAASLIVERPALAFTPPTNAPPPVWKLLGAVVCRAELAKLDVRHAELRLSGMRHAPEVHDANLTGRAIRIDSLAATAPGRIAYARAWRASTGLVAAPFDPPYYRASTQRTRLDTDARTFRLEELALTPKYAVAELNRRKGHQAPAVSIRLPVMLLSGLDFAAFSRDSEIRVARLVAQRPVVRIVSDGRGPINPNRSKVSPEEMLNLPGIVDVRRFDIQNGNLYSQYRSPLTPVPGKLSINRFNGTFRNLSNDRRRQTPATPLTGHATTYLQNICRLDAQVTMYLLDPKGRHRVWGTFGPGPFAILNSMTVPTRLIKFKSGDVRRVGFDLQASRQGVTGTMRAEYAGLQLTLLGYKEEEIKKTLFSRLKSKAANVLVIRDRNPRKRGELVTGEMTSTREPRFSVFTLWRQGIVSGLFHSVGVPQRLAQKLSESKDEAPLPK